MKQVTVERRGAVAVCTIANPPMGYMDRETVPQLAEVLAGLEIDDGVRAIVVTGGLPGVFIRHYSVVELEALSTQLRERGMTVDPANPVPERDIDRLFAAIETMPKPMIAAINGLAMGGGFEFCLACDIRVAEEGDYEVGLPEVKVGILPGAGGTQRLARLVGTARALEMTLRGRTVSPGEAAGLGIVQELAPQGQALNRALAIAEEIGAKPPKAVAHIKRLVRGALATPLAEGLAAERTLFLDLMLTGEANRLMHEMNAGQLDIRNA